jgi:hypothetical protein
MLEKEAVMIMIELRSERTWGAPTDHFRIVDGIPSIEFFNGEMITDQLGKARLVGQGKSRRLQISKSVH